jgi:DNA-binding LytR/AlgR family response regulator
MEQPFTAILIDDEPEAIDLLNIHLSQIPKVKVIGSYSNPQEGFVQISKETPDLVFMDIEMHIFDGFSLLECLKNLKRTPKVILVTGYDKYVPYIRPNENLQLLLKPINPENLQKVIESLSDKQGSINPFVEIQNSISSLKQFQKLGVATLNGVVFIKYSDIVYLQAEGNYTHIILNDTKKITSSYTLKKFQEKLNPQLFLRCHNSNIINSEYLIGIDKKNMQCTLNAGQEIKVSVSKTGMQLLEQLY